MVDKFLNDKDSDPPLKQAVEHLERAEKILEHVHEEEVRAEHEVEEALKEVERAEEEGREFKIIVNGRPKEVSPKKQSYRDIARVAYPDADFSKFLYTITFFNGEGGQEGDLVEGETVKVKNGMVFNVRRSDKS
jgi:hypothetical protein